MTPSEDMLQWPHTRIKNTIILWRVAVPELYQISYFSILDDKLDTQNMAI